VATARAPGFAIEDLLLPDPALVLVVQSIEKPGNLGAALRSANAAGAGMIVADAVTDLVNPNVVRASVGSLFDVPVALATTAETIAFLRQRSITICAAVVDSGRAPWEIDLTDPVAIVIGGEHSGLSLPWSEAADHRLRVPMAVGADSLNASVAAAVILFEAIRQRTAA
jgi:TrmH family RNA methyltransferase